MTTKQTLVGTTTVRPAAIQWLASKFGDTGNTIKASKLHAQSLWWIDIPQKDIEKPKPAAIDLLCEVAPGANKFYYLKVPVEFFKKELPKLWVRKDGKLLRLHLSAEPEEMFVDRRGNGKIGFSGFLQTHWRGRSHIQNLPDF